MLKYTLGQVLSSTRRTSQCNDTHRIYIVVDDQEIILYVGQSVNVRKRIKSHYHRQDSEIGRVMYEFAPKSFDWVVYFLTLNDCAGYVDLAKSTFCHSPVDDAEYKMIRYCGPIFNKVFNASAWRKVKAGELSLESEEASI